MGESRRVERVMRERSPLERLMSYIPGYRGYKEKELRRESDRLVRMEAVNRLKASKALLRRRLANLMNLGRLVGEDVWRLETLTARLDRVTERIERAVSGYAGMFDAVKVREDKLEALIEHDLGLVELAEGIENGVERAADLELGSGDWRAEIDRLMSNVEELDSLVNRRTEILRGLEI
jgi:hypothetical protein